MLLNIFRPPRKIVEEKRNRKFTTYIDKRGKTIEIDLPSTQLEYSYNAAEQVQTITEIIGGTTERSFGYTYDGLDRVASYAETHRNVVKHKETYTYDEYGKITEVKYDSGLTYRYGYKSATDSEIESIAIGENLTVQPKTDVNGRNKGKVVLFNNEKVAEEKITYRKVGDHATNMPGTVWFGSKTNGNYHVSDSVRYAYDKMGNIERVYENGELAIRYQYDSINRLIREDNKILDKTFLFVYDNNGNIVKKTTFNKVSLLDSTLLEELDSEDEVYVYDGDRMVLYNGESCVYDSIGEPTTYRGKEVSWANGYIVRYNGLPISHDAQGRRTDRGGVSFTYDSNGKLIKQSDGFEFFYDQAGVAGMKYNGATYIYRKDAQGNVIALIDETGKIVARYVYDAWGMATAIDVNGVKITSTTHVANLNPFRYRSYNYDTEMKLYFLKTRYYDPEVGRFISEDGIEYLNPQIINGINLYIYCINNPVMYVDPNGTRSWKERWQKIANWFKSTFGAFAEVTKNIVNTVKDYFFFGWESGIDAGHVFGDDSKPISIFVSRPSDFWKIFEYQVGVKIQIGNLVSLVQLDSEALRLHLDGINQPLIFNLV